MYLNLMKQNIAIDLHFQLCHPKKKTQFFFLNKSCTHDQQSGKYVKET